MSKLRLLLWEDCNRNCQGCCNKQWNLKDLPYCVDYSPYSEIMLTGGEPMLYVDRVHSVIRDIRRESKAEIYLYTAMVKYRINESIDLLNALDGITITLHTQRDVLPFKAFASFTNGIKRSLRVNIFKGVYISQIPKGWAVKDNIEWIENCPLPKDEVFMRCVEEDE